MELGRESFGQGYYPQEPSEYLPFIEGYARTAHWDDAWQVSEKAYQASAALRPANCSTWQRSTAGSKNQDASRDRNLALLDKLLNCKKD